MNLERKSLLALKGAARLFFQRRPARLGEVFFGQNARRRIVSYEPLMSLLLFARRAAICFCWGLALGVSASVFAQTNYYTTNGTEYAVIPSLPGDQVFPDVALNSSGGFFVWQDNITDGSGWGISAMRLTANLNADTTWYHGINIQGTNDQERPRVAMLKNGGAVFTWQGGMKGQQHIYARFLNSSDTFLTTTDVVVSTFTNSFQINPAVAVLNNSNVVVVWGSFNQAGSNSLQDVYGQIFSQSGQSLGTNFLINQFTTYNQRTPAIAALKNGGFVVAWVSEQERNGINYSGFDNTNGTVPSQIGLPSVDIYARLYASNGVAQSDEFPVNTDYNPCADPALAVAADGSFMVSWCAKDAVVTDNSWDIYARSFTNASAGAVVRVNTHLYGDQYAPRISAIGGDYMIIWTSLGQDGSREGVFGQFVHENGAMVGGEFKVNTTTVGQQMQPALASDGVSQFLPVWTGYTSTNGFDLFAQRYLNVNGTCYPMNAPFVWAPFTIVSNIYQPQLVVSWPLELGLSVSNYLVYVDGALTNMGTTTSNAWTMTAANGLKTNSTHYFQVSYVKTNGCQPPLSPPTSDTTWGGQSWGGIPFEWMTFYYGVLSVNFDGNTLVYNWPSPNVPLVPGGPTLLQIFLSGGNPKQSSTWLQTLLTKTTQGMFLSWNTQPGLTYQVQMTTNLTSWGVVPNGSARFAAGTNDWMYVGGVPAGYYRVQLLR
jgi:hypothetical protein